MQDSEDPIADRTRRPIVRLLREYAWRYRWSYLAGGFFLWVTNYITVSIPLQIGHAIDALRSGQDLTRSLWVARWQALDHGRLSIEERDPRPWR